MKSRHASTTAEGMALMRAIELLRPAEKRICYDPFARAMVSDFQFFSSKTFIGSGLYEKLYPGGIGFIVARERYIEDFLRSCLVEGLDQVVILGAGFDTRAYRVEGIEKVRVFEVDHPATQELKMKRLKKVIDPLPPHVTFVPIDFTRQNLGDSLFNAGYNEQGKTLFIWQGVTGYLTPEENDGTLAFIANHSGPGSAVIFDYFTSRFLESSKVKNIQWIMHLIGEEFKFGIDEDRIEEFLTQRGFKDVHNADAEELRRLYFTGGNADRTIVGGVDIASARVNK